MIETLPLTNLLLYMYMQYHIHVCSNFLRLVYMNHKPLILLPWVKETCTFVLYKNPVTSSNISVCVHVYTC